ncbi:MAG: hypothetical protein QE271_12290 [Bacteriovoracaceae bacterium]|nr:hypothetical protein [Bacteriovoracaceae bacterium]
MSEKNSKKIVVGIRHSLDSYGTIILLQRQGLQVSAVHVQTMSREIKEEFKIGHLKCQEDNVEKMRKICDALSVPLFLVDMKQVFEEEVIETALNAELLKMAFHPCFHCAKIKLIVLYQKMIKLDQDYFAMGYYAKVRSAPGEDRTQIMAAKDIDYDQAPLVAQAPMEILPRLILPLGEMLKSDIVNIVTNSLPPALMALLNVDPAAVKNPTNQSSCQFFLDKKSVLNKIFPSSFLPKVRLYWADTKTQLSESIDLVDFSVGEEVKIPGLPASMKERAMYLGKLDYSKREAEVGSLDTFSFNQCQIKIMQKMGDVESFKPIHVFCRFNLDAKLFQGILSFRALGFATLQFGELLPFYPSRTWITIYEKNEKSLKAIFTSRILFYWKESDQGDPFFSRYTKLKEYPL